MPPPEVDALVVGGGFYGCALALELRRLFPRVLLVEKEAALLKRASYNNQARIHQGYHYPRSILTSLRSRVNFARFVSEYRDCVYSSFEKYYAIGRIGSKVNTNQFWRFCKSIGAPCGPAPKAVKRLFNADLIEEVFAVTEYAFDALRLQELMERELAAAKVDVALRARVERLASRRDGIEVEVSTVEGPTSYFCQNLFNCTYSQINQVLSASGLPIIPMKHELTEIALVEVPDEIAHLGITVMDGPFFSVMPFPARGLHSLSHVRYTPHHHWHDSLQGNYLDAHEYFQAHRPESHYIHMVKDSQRYLPALAECRHIDSLWEIKTVMPRSEVDDSRPILYQPVQGAPGAFCVLGGKIDNIFDIREALSADLESWRQTA